LVTDETREKCLRDLRLTGSREEITEPLAD